MSKDNDHNELESADKVVDMGDLYGNPIDDSSKQPATEDTPDIDLDDFELSAEEEEALKAKLENIRKSDPFIYR